MATDPRARHGLRAAASLREAQERATLAQKLEVATSKYDAEVRERASEIADLKGKLAETTMPREKDGGQQRLREGVNEDERWSLIKMVNAKVVLFLLCLCGAMCCSPFLCDIRVADFTNTLMTLQVNQLQDRSSGDEITVSRNKRAPRATSAGQSRDHGSMQSDQLATASQGKCAEAEANNHLNLVQELLALRETASRVNTAHQIWRHTTACEGTEAPSEARKEPTASAQSAATSRHAFGHESSANMHNSYNTAGAAQDNAAAQTHAKSAAAPRPRAAAHRPDAASHVRDLTPPRLTQFQAMSRANEVLSRDFGASAYPWTLVSAERHHDNLLMAKLLAKAISQTVSQESLRDLKHTISPDFDTSRRPSPRPLPPSPNPSSDPPPPHPPPPFVRAQSPARSPPCSPISPSFSSRSLSPVTRKVTPHRARNESMSPSRFHLLSQRSTISSANEQQSPTCPRWRV